MRLGKPMEHLQAALKAQTIADPVLKITATIRQLGYAMYLINDHLAWVSYASGAQSMSVTDCAPFATPLQAHSAKIKVFAKDKIARIGQNANRAWAIGIGAYFATWPWV